MKISKEVKIGFWFILAIALAFYMLNFLKGINIFTPTNRYFAVYEDIGGLAVSNAVNIKGYKVGQVRSIKYNFKQQESFVVEVSINKDIKLPKGTVFMLKDDGLMGGKIIDIRLGDSGDNMTSGDTITSAVEANLMTQLGEYMPKIARVVDNLDSISTNINHLVADPSLKAAVKDIAPTIENLNKTMANLRQVTASLPATLAKLDHVAVVAGEKVESLDIVGMQTRLNSTLTEFNNFTQKLNDKNSTLGLLLNDRNLYDNLNSTVKSADSLMIDLKANPKRYVHFSVFGKKK